MSRAARLVVLTLAALAAAPASRPAVGPLIDRLAAAEADTRQQAADAIKSLGEDAVPALRVALRDARPAVAEAAAELLLERLNHPWTDRRDTPAVRLMLNGSNYALQPPEGRAEILAGLRMPSRFPGESRPPLTGASATIVRVLTQDPADQVGWALVPLIDLAPDGVDAGLALDPNARPPGLNVMLAKALVRNADPAALPLIRDALRQDRDNPTADGPQRVTAAGVLAGAEAQSGDPAAAAEVVREAAAAPAGEPSERIKATHLLLGLHAARGPLAGLATDVKAADADAESLTGFALAECARRSGLPTAAGLLLGSAAAARGGESAADRNARLTDAADALAACGADVLACRTLEATVHSADDSSGRVYAAGMTLSLLHEQAGRAGYAADALQRALNYLENPRVRRAIKGPSWTPDEAQTRVYIDCLLDATARGDADAARRHAEALCAIEATDADLVAEALPHVHAALGTTAADAYFGRAHAWAKDKVSDSPTEPEFRNNLAWLCVRCGRQLPDALTTAGQAVAMSPNEAAYLDTLAEARFRTGDVEGALAAEWKAFAIGTEDEWFIRDQIERFEAAAKPR